MSGFTDDPTSGTRNSAMSARTADIPTLQSYGINCRGVTASETRIRLVGYITVSATAPQPRHTPRTPNPTKPCLPSDICVKCVLFICIRRKYRQTFSDPTHANLPDPVMARSSRDITRNEERAMQAAANDLFVATDPIYGNLRGQICGQDRSATECAKLYVDQTIALAAHPEDQRELWNFVSVLGRGMVELASRIPYSEDAVRTKLVDFIHELQKAVVIDPASTTGEPLHFYEERESVLWRDLPEFWLACAEETSSFGESVLLAGLLYSVDVY